MEVRPLDLTSAYYTEVMGMEVVARDEDSVYLKCWDEEDHHSLRLRYAPRVGMDLMSFKVHHEDDLADLVAGEPGPLEQVGDDRGAELGRGRLRKRAAELADCGARSGDDDDVCTHVVDSRKTESRIRPSL